MNIEEQKSILVVALYAAFADGVKDEREHEQIRGIAASLADSAAAPDLAPLYQDVLLKRVSLEAAAAALTDPGQRQLAYEMAVCMCDADGRQSEPERLFLAQLKKLLQPDPERSAAFEREADTIVELGEAAAPAAPAAPAVSAVPGPPGAAQQPGGDLDQSILKYALLNGALELLPQSWASLAIIPLQIKMVYGVGKAHGIELDQGHIKEFLAAAGVGLTSQYLEQFGRKLLGGLLGKAAGKSFGKAGASATGMAFSFATTYALGQVARRYYAGGRTMSTAMLRDTFQNLLEPARQMQAQYLPQIRREAETLDMGRVMSMVRGA